MTTFKAFRITPFIMFAVLLGVLGIGAAPARAAETGPQWTVSSVSRPTDLAVGGEGSFVVLVTNTGGISSGCTHALFEEERSHGEKPVCPEDSPAVTPPITITEEPPVGLEVLPGATAEDELVAKVGGAGGSGVFGNDCLVTGSGDVSCTYGGVVPPDDTLILHFPVRVTAGAPGLVRNVVEAAGGGASATAVMETPTRIAENVAKAREETVFGISPGGASTALSSVQAGGHSDITTAAAFNTANSEGATVGNLKNLVTDEPAGFALDLVDTPACSSILFLREECPIPTQVGVTTAIIVALGGRPSVELAPVYNLAPEPGEIAKIGFNFGTENHYVADIVVRPPGAEGEYGGQATFHNIIASITDVDSVSLTLWGVPAAQAHDALRWNAHAHGDGANSGAFGVSSGAGEAPFFTNSTACGAQSLRAQLKVTSWQHPEESENPGVTEMPLGPMVGCGRLGMEPSLTAEATSDAAYAPTGLDVDTEVPQTNGDAQGLASSTLKDEVVTLPEGMTVNPSSGAGLQTCSEAQYAEETPPEPTAQAKSEGKGCPNQSRLATVKIKTPLLEEEIVGSVFLAESAVHGPQVEAGRNPFDSLLAVYLIARIPNRGVLIKSPGKIELNPTTGQLTTRFEGAPAFAGMPASEGLPPLPFTIAKFEFNQGANAPLVTPPTCGSYTVTAELTPWSNPEGNPLDPSIPSFPIDANCPAGNVPPFNPGVTSYPIHPNAGSYSPFYLKITRQDGEQEITGFATQFPPGLTGNLSGVTECGEGEVQHAREQTGAEAETSPACPANSEIGYSIAEAGVGTLLVQTPGKIYLGGPYDGAPFSVVSVTAAHVGPFDLGTVVIHFPLDINPETADVTIPASPSDAIPHIIKGIVVHVRSVRVYVNRNDFMLNPTSCNPSKLTATVLGNGPSNNTATVTDPFQVADCSSLRFEPKFKVSTSAKTSRVDGASLHVSLTYPAGALGQDANIKEVKVDLPKQLPSRLPTLQKACTEAQFQANPAGCPAASRIGSATAVTPILPVPLTGPAYFVSNGGARWPELVIVLQGDNVTIDLHGETFISKQGVTSSTFPAVPDQPVSSFELTLPEGQYSALAALGNLCASKLVMPTEFTGQNGAVIHQSTPVAVTGCAKTKHAKHKRKRHADKKRAQKRKRR
jgi:hypothetical protein